MLFGFYLFLFLRLTFGASPSYVKSIFGHPGTDEVENEYVDGIEIIETGLPHPTIKKMPQGKYTTTVINPDDYPWPGHELQNTCTLALSKEESNNIKASYMRTNLTQEEMEYHPVAAKQWYTTDEEIAKADRVKIKFSMQPNYQRHFVPGFVPPGEVVTIEIPEPFVNKITIVFNLQTNDIGDKVHCKTRLDSLRFELKLDRKINKVGLPYGGTIVFYYSESDPLEVIISGLIPQPYFYYGMTSDEEWENDLRNRAGPYAYFDTGNVVRMVPSSFIRDSERINDCMHYWRSAVQISQTTARDHHYYNNLRYSRILNPVILKYDTFVPAGAAVAMVGANFVHFPCDWIRESLKFDEATMNPWGTLHEIDHHHQEFWGKTQDSGEMSNNAVNLVVYAKTNLCSGERWTSGWPRYAYASHMLTTDDSYGLQRYSTMLHLFGVNKFKEFVKADQEDTWYPREQYGVAGGEMLRASRVCNRDMRYHWNFHLTTDETLGTKALQELAKMKLKPFHPVATIYTVGYIVDGVGFRTARPYRINPFPQTIDFASSIVQREKKEWFGDFEFKSATFEKGRESAWVEQSKGVYKMTPKANMMDDEEVNVSYLDKTTNEVQVVICQFTQKYSNTIAKATRYGYIPDENNNLMLSYKYIATHPDTKVLEESYRNDGIFFKDYENGNVNMWLAVEEGMISPPENGTYQFTVTADTQAAFYLSEEPLKNDPDLDIDKLICFQQSTQMTFGAGNISKTFTLSSDKNYYFKYLVFPNKGGDKKGRGWAGFKKNNKGDWDTIPGSWLRFKDIDKKLLWENQFVPDFERMYLMDKWLGQKFIANDPSNWHLYKYPKGEVRIKSNDFQGEGTTSITPTQAIIDSDPTTEYRVDWWAGQGVVDFPHVFEIDMGSTNKFRSIRIGGTGNPSLFGMNNFIQIYLAPYNYSASDASYSQSNYSINHPESLIWEGVHNPVANDVIELSKDYSGRYLKIVSINNSLKWKDGWAGRTSISSVEVGDLVHAQKVYPSTNTKYFKYIGNWNERRGGCYYNGKARTGTKGSILEIAIPHDKTEIGIIGDYYPGMGTATVKLDDKVIGTIGKSIDPFTDARKLTKASRSYKSLLFFYNLIDPSINHNMTIEVTNGEITFAGTLTQQMIVDYFTDDGTYENIYKHEFDIDLPDTSDGMNSVSDEFEFTDSGVISTIFSYAKGETRIKKDDVDVKTVFFDKKEIKITESGNFNSNIPIFFSPTQEGSTITIAKEMTNSNVGVASEKSPTVKLSKSDNPLSVMNNKTEGSIKLNFEGNNIEQVKLNNAYNYQGAFNLIVSSTVKTVSFLTVSLFGDSSFLVSKGAKSAKTLEDENDDILVRIEKQLNVAPSSNPSLTNVLLEGVLEINDDSTITLNPKSQLSENSKIVININGSNPVNSNPIVYVKDELDSLPSEIVLSIPQDDDYIEVSNLPIIGSESFENCSIVDSLIKIEGNMKFSYSCRKQGKITSFYINNKDSGEKKKSNAGLIAGVVVAVIVVIAIVAVVVFFVIKRKKKQQESDDIMETVDI